MRGWVCAAALAGSWVLLVASALTFMTPPPSPDSLQMIVRGTVMLAASGVSLLLCALLWRAGS